MIEIKPSFVLEAMSKGQVTERVEGFFSSHSALTKGLTTSPDWILGTYNLFGENPYTGNYYSGKIQVMKKGDVLEVIWKRSDDTETHVGVGIFLDGVLAVGYEALPGMGSDGMAVYRVKGENLLEGLWVRMRLEQIGTEVLRR